MRSRTFVKRTVPCLAVVLAVFTQEIVAYAAMTPTQQDTPQVVSMGPAASVVVQDKATGEEATWAALESIQSGINGSYYNTSTSAGDLNNLRGAAQVQIERVDSINNENHCQLIPQYTDKDLVFKLRVDKTALKSPELLIKDVSVMMALTHYVSMGMGANAGDYQKMSNVVSAIDSPHSWVEGYMNATEGSIISKSRLKNIEKAIMESTIPSAAIKSLENGNPQALANGAAQINKELDALAKQVTELNQKAAAYERQQQKALDKWRSETGALEKYEAMDMKLNDLLLKNDRKGVRDMLEAYLPWQIMEPTEYKAWKTWLEAIEHPDLSNTTVAFRGLDYRTDKIQRTGITSGGEEKFAFMSTVLTKNQGSYTRRLRSLTTNRLKNGDEGQYAFGEKAMAIKITDQMTAHARDPKASSFLSFTYNPMVARRFVAPDIAKTVKGEQVKVPNGGLLAVRVDSRRMIPNIVSMFSGEIEILAPLIIFPDEVVAYHEGEAGQANEFISQVSAKTGIDFSGWEIGQGSVPFREKFKKDGLTFFRHLSEQAINAPFCSKIFFE